MYVAAASGGAGSCGSDTSKGACVEVPLASDLHHELWVSLAPGCRRTMRRVSRENRGTRTVNDSDVETPLKLTGTLGPWDSSTRLGQIQRSDLSGA
jgi:hypothetical protein